MHVFKTQRLLGALALTVLFWLPPDALSRDLERPDDSYRVSQATPSKSKPKKKSRTRALESGTPRESLQEIGEEADRIEARFAKVKKDYGNPDQPFPIEVVKKQYEEATYLYLVEDYEKAALLFYAVLEKANRVNFPEFEEAEYFLAESLELGHNLYPALEYYTRIVEYGPAHRYYDHAVVKMVELYAKTGNFEKFTTYYQSYVARNQGVTPTDEILYALGKTLYAQKDYEAALRSFQQLLSSGGNFPHLAHYYIGVIHVAQGDLDAAVTTCIELLKRPVNTPEQREVEDLTYLALGRILAEQQELDRALDYYGNISRDSRHFVDALYEESWTYIKQENFDQAIRTIDILLLTFPENVNVPRLKLIRGLLQQKRKNYEDALDTYQKLVAEYTSVKDELDRIMHERRDILGYFNELIDNDLSRIESSFLIPALAVRFATADKDMVNVLNIARDVRTELNEMQDSRQVLVDLKNELRKSPYNLLVGMRKARSALGEMQNQILLAKERVIQVEQDSLRQVPEESRDDALAWLAEHENDSRLANQLPQLERDQNELLDVYEDQVQEVQRIAYKLENFVEDLLAQAAAIEKYITYSRESGTLTPDAEQEARFQVASERDMLDSYLRTLSVAQHELGEFDVRRLVRQSQVASEEEFRLEAEKRLEQTRHSMMGLRTRFHVEEALTSELDGLYERLGRISEEVNEFSTELNAIEAQQVEDLRKKIDREEAILTECGSEAQGLDENTQSLAEDVARKSFASIHSQFSDLILKADFGITDVYWQLKEEKSKEIDDNLTQRQNEIDALQEKFEGLQAGDL